MCMTKVLWKITSLLVAIVIASCILPLNSSTVEAQANIVITGVFDKPQPFTEGDTVSFLVTIINPGTTPASNILIAGYLNERLYFLSSTTLASGQSITLTFYLAATAGSHTLRFHADYLGRSASTTGTFTVNPRPTPAASPQPAPIPQPMPIPQPTPAPVLPASDKFDWMLWVACALAVLLIISIAGNILQLLMKPRQQPTLARVQLLDDGQPVGLEQARGYGPGGIHPRTTQSHEVNIHSMDDDRSATRHVREVPSVDNIERTVQEPPGIRQIPAATTNTSEQTTQRIHDLHAGNTDTRPSGTSQVPTEDLTKPKKPYVRLID